MIEPIDFLYNEVNDYTKKKKVTLYFPNVGKKMIDYGNNVIREGTTFVKGKVVLEYNYEPLLATKDFNENFAELKIARDLYQNSSTVYFSLFNSCMQWYVQIKAVKNAFNYETQIENFKKLIRHEIACPIIFYVDANSLDNVQFKKYFQWLVNRASLNNIDSVNMLLYDLENPTLKTPYNEIGAKLINSIHNIVYQRFLNFLERERISNLNKQKISKRITTNSLTSRYDKATLKYLQKALTTGNYINKMPLGNFLKCFSGKEVFPHERIFWKKSKSESYYFFSMVSDDFTIKRLNNSVMFRKGKLDSNNKPANGYAEIDRLIEGGGVK
jgi:hypothetical protein